MDITEQIKKAINDNLPQAVGAELQKRLAQADLFEKNNATLTSQLGEVLAKLNKHADLDSRHVALAARECALLQREQAVLKRENEQALNDLKVLCSAEKVELVKGLFNTVFANNTIRARTLGHENLPTESCYGANGSSSNKSHQSFPIAKETTVEGA